MRRRFLAVAMVAALAVVGLAPTAAHADKPVAVDCDVLATTLIDVDAFLESLPTPPFEADSLGQLLKLLKDDPALFATLNGLILTFSGGTISFDSPSQAVTSTAKCGLIPLLNELIKD